MKIPTRNIGEDLCSYEEKFESSYKTLKSKLSKVFIDPKKVERLERSITSLTNEVPALVTYDAILRINELDSRIKLSYNFEINEKLDFEEVSKLIFEKFKTLEQELIKFGDDPSNRYLYERGTVAHEKKCEERVVSFDFLIPEFFVWRSSQDIG